MGNGIIFHSPKKEKKNKLCGRISKSTLLDRYKSNGLAWVSSPPPPLSLSLHLENLISRSRFFFICFPKHKTKKNGNEIPTYSAAFVVEGP